MRHGACGSCTHAGNGKRTTLQGRAAHLCPVPLTLFLLQEAGHVWLFTTSPPALSPVPLAGQTRLFLPPSSSLPSLQPALLVAPSKESSYTAGKSLRICSWRLRRQPVSNRNSLSLMRFDKNPPLSSLPWHCHSRGHL